MVVGRRVPVESSCAVERVLGGYFLREPHLSNHTLLRAAAAVQPRPSPDNWSLASSRPPLLAQLYSDIGLHREAKILAEQAEQQGAGGGVASLVGSLRGAVGGAGGGVLGSLMGRVGGSSSSGR